MNAACYQYSTGPCPDSLPMTGLAVWVLILLGVALLALGIWGLSKRA